MTLSTISEMVLTFCAGGSLKEGLPDPKLLEGISVVQEEGEVAATSQTELEDGDDKRPPKNCPAITRSHFLPAPGLLTVSSKLAQKIWSLEFVEMDKHLPHNKTIQALENLVSIQEGITGALQQL